MDIIHEKAPRETVGRDTMVRFRMQFQAAAFAALEILSGKEVDRIYCDYHDDFVVRRTVAGAVEYHFFQVKTKARANQQWDVDGVFALRAANTTLAASLRRLVVLLALPAAPRLAGRA